MPSITRGRIAVAWHNRPPKLPKTEHIDVPRKQPGPPRGVVHVRHPWTEIDDKVLVRLRGEGMSWNRIAERMNRARRTVEREAERLGLCRE